MPVAAQRAKTPATLCYRQPVDAPVLDPFRPPSTPYGPGNRGITYATAPGTIVRVAAPGLVRFAGPVAGRQHVSVDHADGLRTTYSYLASVSVRAGQHLAEHEAVGRAGSVLHVGVIRAGRYLDPADQWGRGCPSHGAVLVPLDGGSGSG